MMETTGEIDEGAFDVSSHVEDDGGVIVAAVGDCDLYTAKDLAAALDDALKRPRPRVVVDLSGATFIDSTALGVVVRAHRQAQVAEGELTVRGASEVARRAFQVSGLDRVVPLG